MKSSLYALLAGCLFILLGSSCKVYNQNIMFKVDEQTDLDSLNAQFETLTGNYVLKPNDYISLKVFTGNGELLVDPEYELLSGQKGQPRVEPEKYLIDQTGKANLPLVGQVVVQGYTQPELDSVLSIQYNAYYENSYVKTSCVNRRVVVLGALDGVVVPLANESTTLIEVLALAGGIDNEDRVKNIRLIRGDLQNPSVQVIDLSTIAGMSKANLIVQPNDIVYVEPVRKVVSETFRDAAPIIGLITSVLTLVLLLTSTR